MLARAKVAWSVVAVLILALAGVGYRSVSRTLAETRRITELRSQVESLQTQLRSQEERRDRLSNHLKTTQAHVARLQEQLDASSKEFRASRAELTAIKPEVRRLETALNHARAELDAEKARTAADGTELRGLETALANAREELDAEKGRNLSVAKAATSLQNENERLRAESRRLETALAGVRTELDAEKDRNVTAARAAAALRSEKEQLRAELRQFSDQVRSLEEAGQKSTETRETLNGQISALRQRFDEVLRDKEREIQELAESRRLLEKKLKVQIEREEVSVAQDREHISIRLIDRIVFETGKAVLNGESRKTLDKIHESLAPIRDGLIVIEGHADKRRIHGSLVERFPSNWELSLARAAAVVRYLESKGINPRRMAVAGYSYHRPLDTNLTPIGRRRNRRVEIKLIPPGDVPAPALTKRSP